MMRGLVAADTVFRNQINSRMVDISRNATARLWWESRSVFLQTTSRITLACRVS
jgi:hypothetical protein